MREGESGGGGEGSRRFVGEEEKKKWKEREDMREGREE